MIAYDRLTAAQKLCGHLLAPLHACNHYFGSSSNKSTHPTSPPRKLNYSGTPNSLLRRIGLCDRDHLSKHVLLRVQYFSYNLWQSEHDRIYRENISNLKLKKMCVNLVDESCNKARAMYYRLLRNKFSQEERTFHIDYQNFTNGEIASNL